MERCLERGQISARGVVKVIRVAWTLADLAGRPRPDRGRLRRRTRPVARSAAMSGTRPPRVPSDEEKLARAALTYLAEPGDPALGALLAICSPAEVLAAIKADMLPGTGPGCGDTPASRAALDRALGHWRARTTRTPPRAKSAGRFSRSPAIPASTSWKTASCGSSRRPRAPCTTRRNAMC